VVGSKSASHAAELTAGYYNPRGRNGDARKTPANVQRLRGGAQLHLRGDEGLGAAGARPLRACRASQAGGSSDFKNAD